MQVEHRIGTIAFDDGGSGDPAVLLVHSLGGRSAFWGAVATGLRRRHRVVAIDLRGHGESAAAGPAANTLDDFVDDVLAVADGLGITTFALAGHSFGALVALAAAGPGAGAGGVPAARRCAGCDGPGAGSRARGIPRQRSCGGRTGIRARGLPGQSRACDAGNTRGGPGEPRRHRSRHARRCIYGTLCRGPSGTAGALPRAAPACRRCGERLAHEPASSGARSRHRPGRGASHWVMLDRPSAVQDAMEAFLEGRT